MSIKVAKELPKPVYDISKSFDPTLDELVAEASNLFQTLEKISISIGNLEKKLTDVKAFFPYDLPVSEEEESLPKRPEQYHKDSTSLQIEGYRTKTIRCLSWIPDDNSKKYRLFLVSNEQEVLYYHTDNDSYGSVIFQSKCTLKKALIEYDLPTKVKYFERLIPFMNSFKEHLKKCRIAIEQGDISF